MSRPKIGEVMVELGAFGPSAVARVLMEQAQGQPGRFGEIASRLGLVDVATIGRAVAKQFGLRYAEDDALSRLTPPADALGLLPAPLCRERRLVATFFDPQEKILTLLCADPTDVPALKAMIDAPGSDERKAATIRFDADKAKWSESKGKGVRPSYEAAFQTVTSRSLQPFDAVRVVSDKAKG